MSKMDDAKPYTRKSSNVGKWAFFDFAENKIFSQYFQVFFLLFQVAFGFFDSVWRDMSIKSVQCDLPARYQNSWNVRLRSDKFAQEKKCDAFFGRQKDYCLLLPKSIEKCTFFFYESLRKYVKSGKFERCYQNTTAFAPGSNQRKEM